MRKGRYDLTEERFGVIRKIIAEKSSIKAKIQPLIDILHRAGQQ